MRKTKYLLLTAIVILTPTFVHAQDNCDALLQYGITNMLTASSSRENQSTFHSEMCSDEAERMSDTFVADLRVRYNLAGGSLNASREQIRAYQRRHCSALGQSVAGRELQQFESRFISAELANAFNACRALSARGLQVSTNISNNRFATFSITFTGAGVGFLMTGLHSLPQGAWTCRGRVGDSNQVVNENTSLAISNNALSISCERTVQMVMLGNQQFMTAPASQLAIHTQLSNIVIPFTEVPPPQMSQDRIERFENDLRLGSVPIGAILPWAGSLDSLPSNWRLCNGDEVDRINFPELFTAIGTTWGRVEGTTRFKLPDLRGLFLRGVDGGAGRDPDANARRPFGTGDSASVGSIQGDEISRHDHGGGDHTHTTGLHRGAQSNWDGPVVRTQASESPNPTSNSGRIINPNGGSETRPKNASVYWVIRVR